MNQHINSLLENLSFRRKSSESAQQSNDKQQQQQVVPSDNGHPSGGDSENVTSKSRTSIFKTFISDNGGATNIFHSLIKCPENLSNHLNSAMSSSSNSSTSTSTSNGNCKTTKDDDNNNQQASQTAFISVTTTESDANNMHNNAVVTCHSSSNGGGGGSGNKKRNSVVKALHNTNGDFQRELSPSPRIHRKSSHDIRLLRNNQMIPEFEDVGKAAGALVVKPLKSKNIITRNETFDTLHSRAIDVSFFLLFKVINYAASNHIPCYPTTHLPSSSTLSVAAAAKSFSMS